MPEIHFKNNSNPKGIQFNHNDVSKVYVNRNLVWSKPVQIVADGVYDPRQINTMWLDTARTQPVTTAGQRVAVLDDISGHGRHAYQSDVNLRPTYYEDEYGMGALHFGNNRGQCLMVDVGKPMTRVKVWNSGVDLGVWGVYKNTEVDGTSASQTHKIPLGPKGYHVSWTNAIMAIVFPSTSLTPEQESKIQTEFQQAALQYHNGSVGQQFPPSGFRAFVTPDHKLHRMFYGVRDEFIQSLNNFNVVGATSLQLTFHGSKYNFPLDQWNTSTVTNMSRMFQINHVFNQNLSSWDVSNVTNMTSIFSRSYSFNNGDVRGGSSIPLLWHTPKLETAAQAFGYTPFNQQMPNFDLSHATSCAEFFVGATKFNQPVNHFNVGHNVPANKQISCERMFNNATSFNQNVSNFDMTRVTNVISMFNRAINFNNGETSNTSTAPLTWDLENTISANLMFSGAVKFNQDVDSFKMFSAENVTSMFASCTIFNQNLSSWKLLHTTNASAMFFNASSFNGDVSNFSMPNVTTTYSMFSGAQKFNQDISKWNMSQNSQFSFMFKDAIVFNQPLNTWDVGSATAMSNMFDGAAAFDQYLNLWCISSITSEPSSFRRGTPASFDASKQPHWGSCPIRPSIHFDVAFRLNVDTRLNVNT